MAPPPVPNSSRSAPTNPFYANGNRPPASPPPMYSSQPPQAVTYGSLSDLTRGRPTPAAPQQSFTYQPQPERQGYRTSTPAEQSGGRRVPPLPKEGMMPDLPRDPPRRNPASASAPPPPPPSRGAAATIQGYSPAGAQASVNSAAERVKDGFNSIATNERKDQVFSGLGKLGAGAAKLTAKGVYQVGKFASK
ncbi:hypothetical protein IAR55_003267 [Kwoniella newhampshirensis]|uniref:Uncharacterized protein n=1 Tax=Kwoniella newhampshirensis TaxID=1651941 RepID=A0AAW0YYI7_9TREE